MDLEPFAWTVKGTLIYIHKISDNLFVAKKHESFFDEEKILKEYDGKYRYWRPIDYESKYDVVYFASLEEVIKCLTMLSQTI